MAENSGPPKRQLILRAALAVFAARGFHGARMEEIAQEAGVGKGTVYEYFQSKEHLFRDTLKEGLEFYISHVRLDLEREVTATDKLRALVKNNFTLACRFRPLARIAMMETIPIDEKFRVWLREMHLEVLEMISGIVRQGIERGEFRAINHELFARLFYGGLSLTLSPFNHLEMDENEIDRYAAEIIEYYLKGIGA